MHLAILSSGPGWHVQDLLRAASERGHTATLVDFRTLHAGVSLNGWDSLLDGADAVIVRSMPPGSLEQVVFRMGVLHRLHADAFPVLNPPAALECCIDKYATTAKLAAAGLPVPATVVCQDADAAQAAYERLGGDVVVKPLFGSEGRGMVRVTDAETAWRTFRTLERLQAVLYLQRFVPHEGFDLRAFVLAGRVVAAMRRRGGRDWRTNVAQGARAEAAALGEMETALALRAADVVGVEAGGVDLLPGRDGKVYVLEVNAVPGWRALAPATGVDVAKLLVEYAASAAAFRRGP